MHPGSPSLLDLGWDDGWAATLAASPPPTGIPGRVARIDRGVSTVLAAHGRVRVGAVAGLTLAVGDWVVLTQDAVTGGWSLSGILPRRRVFERDGDGPATTQVVAANVDTVMVAVALDGFLSVRHLQRFVALAWQSGATPAVVITKADLAPPEELLRRVATVADAAVGVAVHVLSSATGRGLESLAQYLTPGRTVALVGLSGAGKSTLVNVLAGGHGLATGAVRADGKGRHTTTHRELVAIPGGGMVIDTPGMRALSVSTAVEGVARVFADVEDLDGRCAMRSCSHTTEVACAVVAAVAAGDLSATRLADWRRLRVEDPAQDRRLVRLRIEERKRRRVAAKATRRGRRSPA